MDAAEEARMAYEAAKAALDAKSSPSRPSDMASYDTAKRQKVADAAKAAYDAAKAASGCGRDGCDVAGRRPWRSGMPHSDRRG